MSVFHTRSSGYKVGVVLLFVAAILYVVGYASPFWYEAYGYFEGLWMSCSEMKCDMMPAADANYYKWAYAVRTLESVCLIGLLTSCVYCVITNCCRSVPTRRTRFLEVVSAVSGHIGFVGCMVYVGGTYDGARQDSLSWSVFMSAFGSALSVFAAITILVCNKPLLNPSPPAGSPVALTTLSQGHEQGQGQGQGQAAAGSHGDQAQPQTRNASTVGGGGGSTQSYGNPHPSGFRQPEGHPHAYEGRRCRGSASSRQSVLRQPDTWNSERRLAARRSRSRVPVQSDGNPQPYADNSEPCVPVPQSVGYPVGYPQSVRYPVGYPQSYEERQSAHNSQPSFGYTGSNTERQSMGYPGSEGESMGYPGSDNERQSVRYTGSEGERQSMGYPGSEGERQSKGYTESNNQRQSMGYTESNNDRENMGYPGSDVERQSVGYPDRQSEEGSQPPCVFSQSDRSYLLPD